MTGLRLEDGKLAHRFIICDLAIRSVEHDLKQLDGLKLKKALQNIYEEILKELFNERVQINKEMQAAHLKYYKTVKIDEYFTDYYFTKHTGDTSMTYANMNLFHKVNDKIEDMIKQKSHPNE